MADRRDDLDSWLSERIDPLPPPSGTFELIKRRARRRKYRRLAITATSAAIIVAAAVTVPQVVNLHVLNPSSGPAAVAGAHFLRDVDRRRPRRVLSVRAPVAVRDPLVGARGCGGRTR